MEIANDVAPAPTITSQVKSRVEYIYPLLAVTFIFAGLTGHDPWKADEAYVFGVVQHMLQTSDWLVPTLAGEPFMEKPPLFYWVAALTAHALSPWLPLHDGARAASGLLMLLNAWLVAAAARAWWGRYIGWHAMLVLIGCFGMVVQSHSMLPDISLLTGFALSAVGFTTALRLPLRSGILIGLGSAVGFLSKGLIAPCVIGLTALVLPICFVQWRKRDYARTLALAAIVSLPFCIAWPWALYLRFPDLFREWFWENNVGRFLGFSVWKLRTEHTPWLWTKTIPWFTFPGLPLALLTLWRRRRNALSEPAIQYSVAAFAVLMSTLAMSASARELYAWPLLIPIAIVAAPAAVSLPEGAERIWIWLGCALFAVLATGILAIWTIMMITGAPPHWPLLLRLLPGDFVPRFELFRFVFAIVLVAGAAWIVHAVRDLRGKGLAIWTAGLALVWSLLMTLGTPWLDYMKSYRSVFSGMPLPGKGDCIASVNLGEGERAMLHYITAHDPVRREVAPHASCTLLLVQRQAGAEPPAIDASKWQQIWQARRPGAAIERFWLYRSIRSD